MSQENRSEEKDPASFAQELKTIGDEKRRALFNEAWLLLAAMGISIDQLSEEQQRYLSSWQEGT